MKRKKKIFTKPITYLFIAAIIAAGVMAIIFNNYHKTESRSEAAVDLPRAKMIKIPAGKFLMGSQEGFPDEHPAHWVTLDTFYLDEHEVTTADFARFVAATGYRTDAEKFGWSLLFNTDEGKWEKADGADWRHPEGPQSHAADLEPVTQVSWQDAQAYAHWVHKRLPTEAEFEYAARGGLAEKHYAWGDELRPQGKEMANLWQGHFPDENKVADGYLRRAPVGSFPANGYGLRDITGNVWEWCADWYDPNYFSNSATNNPTGPQSGNERVTRGGSWLCSENYCQGYRVSARSHASPDTGLNNLGFRCASDSTNEEK